MKEKKTTPPKFNIYWIYGAVIFVLLGLSLFGGNDWQTMSKTNISNFEKYLNSGEVSEVIVIRNKSSVRVTLTPDAKAVNTNLLLVKIWSGKYQRGLISSK